MPARSYEITQNWADMTPAARVAWFNSDGPAFEADRIEFMRALARYAGSIKTHSAHDNVSFDVEAFLNDVLSRADRVLAPEVQEYLGV